MDQQGERRPSGGSLRTRQVHRREFGRVDHDRDTGDPGPGDGERDDRELGRAQGLELAEAATRIHDGAPGVTDEIGEAAGRHFNEEQLSAITLEIALTNFFNRINRTVREQVGKTW